MRTAKTASHLESIIFTIVKYLVILDAALVAALLADALITGMSLTEVIPFALILLVASVPVALPATFTLACDDATQDPIDLAILNAARSMWSA